MGKAAKLNTLTKEKYDVNHEIGTKVPFSSKLRPPIKLANKKYRK